MDLVLPVALMHKAAVVAFEQFRVSLAATLSNGLFEEETVSCL